MSASMMKRSAASAKATRPATVSRSRAVTCKAVNFNNAASAAAAAAAAAVLTLSPASVQALEKPFQNVDVDRLQSNVARNTPGIPDTIPRNLNEQSDKNVRQAVKDNIPNVNTNPISNFINTAVGNRGKALDGTPDVGAAARDAGNKVQGAVKNVNVPDAGNAARSASNAASDAGDKLKGAAQQVKNSLPFATIGNPLESMKNSINDAALNTGTNDSSNPNDNKQFNKDQMPASYNQKSYTAADQGAPDTIPRPGAAKQDPYNLKQIQDKAAEVTSKAASKLPLATLGNPLETLKDTEATVNKAAPGIFNANSQGFGRDQVPANYQQREFASADQASRPYNIPTNNTQDLKNSPSVTGPDGEAAQAQVRDNSKQVKRNL